MKIWAYEICFCQYETGFQVESLHSTKALAERAMHDQKEQDLYDGYRVVEWEIDEK